MSGTQRCLSICLLLIAGLVPLQPRGARAQDLSPASPAPTGLSLAGPALAGTIPAAPPPPPEIAYSELLRRIERHEVSSVVISGQRVEGTLEDGGRFTTVSPGPNNASLISALIGHDVRVSGAPSYSPPEGGVVQMLAGGLNAALPMLLLIGAWLYLNGRQQGSPRNIDSSRMHRSPAHELAPGSVRTTLADVAGIDEVKQEVAEIVGYLREPGKYLDLGAKLPRGVLLAGAPGTGKTLLARAIAGEAGVQFFSISGSAFVELYAGVGAARVRDLFTQAKEHSPCIVFIDEIDAVGRHRSASGVGANDEREQTLNQLLVEMDGFTGAEGIIVIAATNRPDVLDPALLRPGRFDRRIAVPLPDVRGREAIVQVHLRDVRIADDVNARAIARAAAGFSGAELANLVNEAALLAAREDVKEVARGHFERALDKLTLGLERATARPSQTERLAAAYREAGHAIVSFVAPEPHPVRKITIVPRGASLGAAAEGPAGERFSSTRRALESRLCVLLAGRVAEELAVGGECVTTGAADKLALASELARRMVAQYGFCEPLGPVNYLGDADAPASMAAAGLTQEGTVREDLSRGTAATVDRESRKLLALSHARARAILEAHRDALHALAAALMRLETLDADQIREVLERHGPAALRAGRSSTLECGGSGPRGTASALPSPELRATYAAVRRRRPVICSASRGMI